MEFTEFMRQLGRMCQSHPICNYCEFKGFCCDDPITTVAKNESVENLQKMEQIVEQWAKEHPIKTRQSEFLKQFPKADLDYNGVLKIYPCLIDSEYCTDDKRLHNCGTCVKEYWFSEASE